MLGNDADALDATQDTLVAVLKALGRFDGRSSFATWIYRIATNTCLDEIRRRRRRPVTGIAADVAEVGNGSGGTGGGGRSRGGGPGSIGDVNAGHDPADIVAARLDIDAALAALPLEFRTAVVLRDVCDLPYDEIADILDVPVGTVRSRIARARTALAATWTTETTEHDPSSDELQGVVGRPVGGDVRNHSGAPDVKTREMEPTDAPDSVTASQEEERT